MPPPAPEDWTPALPIWGWEEVYSFASFNSPGSTSPLDVALGADCKIYVADVQRSEVVQLHPNGQPTGVRFRLPGESMPGETGRLQGVAVDPQGNVYATDYTRNLVHKFSPNGGLTATWGRCTPQPSANRFCDPKKEPGLFIGPSGIAADGRGNVYVSESAGTRIQKMNAQGQSQGTWDMASRGLGQLFILGGMAVDAGGFVYVADGFNDYIYKFDPNGTLAGRFGGHGNENGQLRIARGVAVDLAGNIYTSDQDNWRVQKLQPDGSFEMQWRNCLIGTVEECEIPGAGSEPGQFFDNRGVVVDAQGTLYVADYGNDRVQRLMIVGYTDPIPPPEE